MAEQSLKDKTVKGVAWSGIDNVAQYTVSFVVSVVLARLLSPDDYGLLGIIAVFTAVCQTLVNGGFSFALIRKQNATEEDYNTAFFVNMAMSLFLYGVVFMCAPQISIFFNRPELIALTRVSMLGVIIGALALVQQTRLTKLIDFKTQTKISFFASVFSGIVGISMALLDFGVWALVAQVLTMHTVRTVLLYVYNKWIPRFRFSSRSFHDMFSFSWKLMASGIIDTVWKELYQVIIGKFYTPATLGQYTRSKQLAQMFSSNLTNVIQRVTYPVLSDIQNDKERMVSAYRRIIKITMFITAISMFFLGAISEPLLYCLIGSKWHDAAIYLPLICISGSTYPLHAINLNMLQVQGRSDLFLGLEIVKKIVGTIPLAVCIFYGILPMLYVNLISAIISFLLNSHYSGCLLGYSSWMQLKDIAPSYGIAILIALSVWFLKYLPLSCWIVLPIQIVVGTSAFIVICKGLRVKEYEELKKIAMPMIQKIKTR